jgi:transcriptional regulator with XRE-family HTH domain
MRFWQPAFSRRLREARRARGWNRVELAERSGVFSQQINRYEAPRYLRGVGQGPLIGTIYRLADALDVSIDWLVGRTEAGGPQSI